MDRCFFVTTGILIVALILPGCLDFTEEKTNSDEMKVDDVYYFSSSGIAIELQIKYGNNVTIEQHRLIACDVKPWIGCIDQTYESEALSFDIPSNASEQTYGVWIDTTTYSSSAFFMLEGNAGQIFTDQGIGFIMFTSNYNETKADTWNITDANNDGKLQVCHIGLSEELSIFHTHFVDEMTNNSSLDEQNHAIYQRYIGYLELFEDKDVAGLYNNYCEVDMSLAYLVTDSSYIE